MNRNEVIEKSAQLFLQVLEHNDNSLTDAVYESINNLREALAMPKDAEIGDAVQEAELYDPPQADAERVALLERIDNHMEDNSDLFDLLRDIRAYLQGSA